MSDDIDTREQGQAIINGDDYQAKVKAGDKAIGRILGRNQTNFEDWWIVGEAFLEIRHAAFTLAGTDDIQSPVYKKQFSALVNKTRMRDVDAVTRSDMLKLAEHQDDVRLWWAGLADSQRLRWTNPKTVRKEYEKANKPKDKFPKLAKPKGETAEHEPNTPAEVAAALGLRERPLDMVRIGTDAQANVVEIVKVVDSLGLDPVARGDLLFRMSECLARPEDLPDIDNGWMEDKD